MNVYDEPTARRHRVEDPAHQPDRQRPLFVDLRVAVTSCGLKIALIGHPRNKPARITNCEECFG